MDERYRVELSPGELELVEVGLTMLLKAEDDPSTIEQVKKLLPRLHAAAAAASPQSPSDGVGEIGAGPT